MANLTAKEELKRTSFAVLKMTGHHSQCQWQKRDSHKVVTKSPETKKKWRASLQPQTKAHLCHLLSSHRMRTTRMLRLPLLPPEEVRGHRGAFEPPNTGAEFHCHSVVRSAQRSSSGGGPAYTAPTPGPAWSGHGGG